MPVGFGKTPGRTQVATGVPNLAEAPGGYQRFFRLSQLGYGTAGKGRKIEDIWATFLQELSDMGIPGETRSRLEALGPKRVLGPKGLGKSITMGLGKENFKVLRETLAVAKGATRGYKPALIRGKWEYLLKSLTEDPQFATEDGRRILEKLRKVDPAKIAKIGSTAPLSVLASRGQDPLVIRMFNKIFKQPNTPVLPAGITETLKAANAGKLPSVARGAAKTLAAEGVAVGGIGRRITKGLMGAGKIGPVGAAITLGFGAMQASDILGRPGRAKKLAAQGYTELGPSSSADYLRHVVGQQEALSRRQVTMQKFEPAMWEEVVRILSDAGPSRSTLTSTERRIGSSPQAGAAQQGRSSEDMNFLLNELFNQMGG